jgi:hypothetical protein
MSEASINSRSRMRRLHGLLAPGLLLLCSQLNAQAPAEDRFQLLAQYRSYGGLVATTVAEGPVSGSERLYASYLYADNTLDVIAVDPANGSSEVFPNPVPREYGARNIAIGPNGDVYLGSLPHAHFLRVDRKAHRMIDLGQPSPSEEYIWDVAFGADHRLYGVTYPGCRLVRYDPATGKLEDLGKMDPTEKYGRWIVGGRDDFMYIGLGSAKANVAVFNTRTGELREILPKDAQVVGIPKPYIGVDGKTYATLNNRLFQITGFGIHEIPLSAKTEPINPDVLKDGRGLSLSEGVLTIQQPKTHTEQKIKITYTGEDLQIFRIGFGPDGALYGSSVLPLHFLKLDAAKHSIDELGTLGGGEAYSFLAHDKKLLIATYSAMAPLMSYSPGEPVKPAASGNPELISYAGSDSAWRPQAMIHGPDGLVYVGALAGYGNLEGPLLSWDGTAASVKTYGGLVHNQSVVSLAVWRDQVVCGTTTSGGGGAHPDQSDAHLFLWNPQTKSKELDLIPVPGAQTITDLVTAKNGLVYGIAASGGLVFGISGPGNSYTLFAYDPAGRKVIAQEKLPLQGIVYNGIGLDADGKIVGLADDEIFTIDQDSHKFRVIQKSPVKITGGFALRDGAVYFVSNSKIYRYRLR